MLDFTSFTSTTGLAPVTNVRAEAKVQWLRHKYWYIVAITASLAIDGFLGPDRARFFGLCIFALVLRYLWIWQTLHRALMQQFAERNGFRFVARGDSKHRLGKLFAHAFTCITTNVVSGEYLGYPFELFNYQYEVGSGKSKITYEATVLQYTFRGLVPQFSLTERTDSLPAIHRLALGQRVYTLEGDFHKYFVVHVKELHEIEMLEVLTPEIMAFLIDRGCKLSFEFVGRNLFIYQDHQIATKDELETFFLLTRLLVDRINHRIQRLHDDVTAIMEVGEKRR